MIICKNAREYWAELWRLRGKGWEKHQKEIEPLRSAFHSIEDPSIEEIRNIEKTEREIASRCYQEAEDFEKFHPIKPLYVYKSRRKFYEIRFIEKSPHLWVSPTPIDKKTLKEKTNAWILPIPFDGHAVDVIDCFSCNRPFVRMHPNERFCGFCKRIRDKKIRYCQNPDCGKPLPYGKHGKAKYCNGACRTAACRIRKKESL